MKDATESAALKNRIAAEAAGVRADALLELHEQGAADANVLAVLEALADDVRRLDQRVADLEAVVAWTRSWTREPVDAGSHFRAAVQSLDYEGVSAVLAGVYPADELEAVDWPAVLHGTIRVLCARGEPWTPFHARLLEAICPRFVNVNARFDIPHLVHGFSPLFLTTCMKNVSVLRGLLALPASVGLDPNCTGTGIDTDTALGVACKLANPDCIEALLQVADVNVNHNNRWLESSRVHRIAMRIFVASKPSLVCVRAAFPCSWSFARQH
jgi:hypothetical protein